MLRRSVNTEWSFAFIHEIHGGSLEPLQTLPAVIDGALRFTCMAWLEPNKRARGQWRRIVDA